MKFTVLNQTLLTGVKLLLARGKASSKDVYLNDDALFELTEEGLECRFLDSNRCIYGALSIPVSEKTTTGVLPIKDLLLFKNYLERFPTKSKLTITKKKGELIIEGTINLLTTKEAHFPLSSESIINSWVEKENYPITMNKFPSIPSLENPGKEIKLDCVAKVKVTDIQGVIKDGEVVKFGMYTLKLEPKSLSIMAGEPPGIFTKTRAEIEVPKRNSKARLVFTYGFPNVFNKNLSGHVTLYMADDESLMVRKESPEYTMEYIIASTGQD